MKLKRKGPSINKKFTRGKVYHVNEGSITTNSSLEPVCTIINDSHERHLENVAALEEVLNEVIDRELDDNV